MSNPSPGAPDIIGPCTSNIGTLALIAIVVYIYVLSIYARPRAYLSLAQVDHFPALCEPDKECHRNGHGRKCQDVSHQQERGHMCLHSQEQGLGKQLAHGQAYGRLGCVILPPGSNVYTYTQWEINVLMLQG